MKVKNLATIVDLDGTFLNKMENINEKIRLSASERTKHIEEFAAAFMKRHGTIDPNEIVAVQDYTNFTQVKTYFIKKTDEQMLNKGI